MNLKKLNFKAVKSVKPVKKLTTLSIQNMSKVMGGGCYSCECCAIILK